VAVLYDPVFAKINFIDVDGRTAFMAVPRVVEARGQPIRNPVTGDPHRARVSLSLRLSRQGLLITFCFQPSQVRARPWPSRASMSFASSKSR